MLDKLYETSLEKREELTGEITALHAVCPDAHEWWHDLEIPAGSESRTIAGIDGSFNKINFRGFIFYAVAAESVISDGNGIRTLAEADVNLLRPYRHARSRLETYMSIFELKLALQTLNTTDVDYLLIDGSLFGHTIRPVPFEVHLPAEVRKEVIRNHLPVVRDEVSRGRVEVSTHSLGSTLMEEFGDVGGDAIVFLEYLEKLEVLRALLSQKERLVGISKTSRRTDCFGSVVPDIAIFEGACTGTGYSSPLPLRIMREAKGAFPMLDKFFRQISFSHFYVRLEERKNVLRFEVPWQITRERAEDLLSHLMPVCAGGYPYLLKRAHNDVVIRRRDMKRLVRIFDLHERRGREML